LQSFDQVNQALVFVDTLIHLGKKKILDDMYLGDVTSETISEETELTKKEIFFNLFLNIKVVRTILIVKMTKVTYLTGMLAKKDLLLQRLYDNCTRYC
jgi:hypothetical protein